MYTIRYNRTTNHIAGIEEKLTGGNSLSYATSACPALSRGGYTMATGKQFEDIADALHSAQYAGGRKTCQTCARKAQTLIDQRNPERTSTP